MAWQSVWLHPWAWLPFFAKDAEGNDFFFRGCTDREVRPFFPKVSKTKAFFQRLPKTKKHSFSEVLLTINLIARE